MLLIDTNIFIDYFHGYKPAVDYLEGLQDNAVLSVLVVTEMLAGVRNKREAALIENIKDVFEKLGVNLEVAELAGQYLAGYGRSHGTGFTDALLAATASVHGCTLVTRNRRHFPMLTDIVVPY